MCEKQAELTKVGNDIEMTVKDKKGDKKYRARISDGRLLWNDGDIWSRKHTHKCFVFRLEDRAFSLKLIKAWDEWKELADVGFANGIPRFRKLKLKNSNKKNLDWLTLSNESDTRMVRIGGGCATLWQAMALSANEPGRYAKHIHLLQPSLATGGAGVAIKRAYDIRVSPGLTSFEIAQNMMLEGLKPAAIVITDGEKLGGEFLEGHITGIEEDLCMRSDLFLYFREAAHQAVRRRILDTRGRTPHIPENGCLVCQNVRVIRDTLENGYEELQRFFEMPVVLCISLKNLNPHQSPSPQSRVEIASFDHEAYKTVMRNKFEMSIKAAIQNHCNVITVSDQGVAKLHNKPELFGMALGEALRKCRSKPPRLMLSGSSAFIAAMKRTLLPADAEDAS
jgi:hypothetical protein